MTANIGSSVVITCNITLNTAIGSDLSVLSFTWYHDKKITKGMLFHRFDKIVFTTTLEIALVELSNAGVYQCSAGIVGGNTITSNTTSLCLKGIIIIYKLFYILIIFSKIVAEKDIYPTSVFTDLQLGQKFAENCVKGRITGLFISWWINDTIFNNGNGIYISSLKPSDNNTIYACNISIQKNPLGCPQNQFREYVIRLKSKNLFIYNKHKYKN